MKYKVIGPCLALFSIQNVGIVLEAQYIVIPTLHYGGATQSGHLTADRILEVHT
jgi:hypothetical protein